MSQLQISLSHDLQRLRNEGYNVRVWPDSGYLVVADVPYVNGRREVARGQLVAKLALAGDVTVIPEDHVAYFIGDHPCRADGVEIPQIKNASTAQTLAPGLEIHHTFSAKPQTPYPDFHAKMTTYVAIIEGQAQVVDPDANARTHPVIEPEQGLDEGSVFKYVNTASSRAEIDAITSKLVLPKIAIVGLGGTGSYVLDFVAKTPVKEIHIFDGDSFLQHNAFRAPGAASLEELQERPSKLGYLSGIYSNMRHGIVCHEQYVDSENVELLRGMSFVFLCLDNGTAKRAIVDKLEEFGIPFVDAGMGLYSSEGSLGGTLRVTTSTPEKRDHFRARTPFSDGNGHNEYSQNIQIAELNALNAALAVIKWKKFFGFYLDMEPEHYTTYTLNGNDLLNGNK